MLRAVCRHHLDLKKGCDEKDVEEIKRCIREIKDNDLMDDLLNEVREARYTIEELTHKRRERRPLSMELSRKTLSEIRRYHNPPADLHRVMQGVLLLLGEDEETTSVSDVTRISLSFVSCEMGTITCQLCNRLEFYTFNSFLIKTAWLK
jgi:hypothetical protein